MTRHFIVRSPDGRLIEHEAETLAGLRAIIVAPGYEVAFEVLDGLRVEPLPDGLPHYSLMSHLLLRYGEELAEWNRNYIVHEAHIQMRSDAPLPKLKTDHRQPK